LNFDLSRFGFRIDGQNGEKERGAYLNHNIFIKKITLQPKYQKIQLLQQQLLQ
jgi:hypothetical protein